MVLVLAAGWSSVCWLRRCLSHFRALQPRRRPAPAAPPTPPLAGPRPRRHRLTPHGRAGSRRAPTEAVARVSDLSQRQFIASYDAGRGQRYYLFGSELPSRLW